MGDKGDLALNDLNRYRKTSSKLALEVHSSCEVPAGCGGVVLRWRRPGADVGIHVWIHKSCRMEGIFLDGEPLEESRATVAPGRHVIALVAEDPGSEGFFMLRMTLEPDIASARQKQVHSRAGAGFRASTTAPGEGWQLPDFDDAAFTPLVERDVPQPDEKKKWEWETLREQGVKGLGLQAPAPRAWVRFTFHVDHEGFS